MGTHLIHHISTLNQQHQKHLKPQQTFDLTRTQLDSTPNQHTMSTNFLNFANNPQLSLMQLVPFLQPFQPIMVPATYSPLEDVDMTACSTLLAIKHTSPRSTVKTNVLKRKIMDTADDFHARECKTPPLQTTQTPTRSHKRKCPYSDEESDSESVTSSASTVLSHHHHHQDVLMATPLRGVKAIAAIDVSPQHATQAISLSTRKPVSAPKRAKVLSVGLVLPAISVSTHALKNKTVIKVSRC